MTAKPTWLIMVPRSPTIMRLQIFSDSMTKFHESLNKLAKLGKSSDACCSPRSAMTLEARAWASSAAEDSVLDNSS